MQTLAYRGIGCGRPGQDFAGSVHNFLYRFVRTLQLRILVINLIKRQKIMKLKSLLKSTLLLCTLVVGNVCAWASTQSWDLTTATYQSATGDIVIWSSNNVTFTAEKNGGTNVNNFLGGTGGNTHTRFYNKNILTFTPHNDASISTIVVHVTSSSGGAANITGGTKTNCTISSDGQDVTITPTTATSECSVQLSNTIRVENVTVTYTGGSSATTAVANFTDSPAFITVGDNYTNTLETTPDGLTVTYASEDTDIATVNTTTGEVTGVDEGIVKITASWVQQTVGGTLYAEGNKPYELYVGHAITDAYFDFTGYQNYGSGVPLTVSANTYKGSDEYVFTAGKITLKTGGESNKYFAWYNVTDAKNELRFYTGTNFTLSAPDGYVITNVEFTGKSNVEKMTVSSGSLSGNNTASTWTGFAQSVTFTRGGGNPGYYTMAITYIPATATINLASACTDGAGNYYGTFSIDRAFVVPADLTVSAITGTSGATLTLDNYATGDVVPANTGVLVSSTTAGDHTVTLSSEAGTAKTGNMLKPSSETMTGDYLFYRLTMHNGTDLGFWWGAADGAAFDIAVNKAYLAVPSPAREFDGFFRHHDRHQVGSGFRVNG